MSQGASRPIGLLIVTEKFRLLQSIWYEKGMDMRSIVHFFELGANGLFPGRLKHFFAILLLWVGSIFPGATYAGEEMILVPGGEFVMGSDELLNASPEHTVYVDSFYIDKFEVTVGQYQMFVKKTGGTFPPELKWGCMDDHPVVNVTWEEAGAFCAWADKRLPTEAEWEKAARGVDGRTFPWAGEEEVGPEAKIANVLGEKDGYAAIAPAGSFLSGASAYGLMDMAGNAWEWCADWYGSQYYAQSPERNPKGPADGERRVLRGGAWNNTMLDTPEFVVM